MKNFVQNEVPKRICNKCKEEKLIIEYNRARNWDGFNTICKSCVKGTSKKLLNVRLTEVNPSPIKFRDIF